MRNDMFKHLKFSLNQREIYFSVLKMQKTCKFRVFGYFSTQKVGFRRYKFRTFKHIIPHLV